MSRPGDRGPDRPLDDDGSDLWRRVTSGVRPLRRRAADRPGARPAPEPEGSGAPEPAAADRKGLPSRPSRDAAIPHGDLTHGVAPGVDSRTLTRLRRGQIRIEDEIDLHRYTQEQAHCALTAFLGAAQHEGRRCVLVITGKGSRSLGPSGVLRRAVPDWINLPPNRPRVLAFCHATPADGGEGALYVLLRRPR